MAPNTMRRAMLVIAFGAISTACAHPCPPPGPTTQHPITPAQRAQLVDASSGDSNSGCRAVCRSFDAMPGDGGTPADSGLDGFVVGCSISTQAGTEIVTCSYFRVCH